VDNIHCSSHPFDIGLSGGVVDGYDVEFDLEVLAGFPERSMRRFGNNPNQSVRPSGYVGDLHLRFRDSFCLSRPISVSLDRHQDRLGSARRRCLLVAQLV
jgi:hypothetical protein